MSGKLEAYSPPTVSTTRPGVYMRDPDDSQWILSEGAREISGFLWWVPAFTCQPVARRPRPLTACAAARSSELAKPSSRLIFTPWVLGNPVRPMHT